MRADLSAGTLNFAVSDLLRKLPNHGVGAIVTRDTWHPESKKYWEVVEVAPSTVGAVQGCSQVCVRMPHDACSDRRGYCASFLSACPHSVRSQRAKAGNQEIEA